LVRQTLDPARLRKAFRTIGTREETARTAARRFQSRVNDRHIRSSELAASYAADLPAGLRHLVVILDEYPPITTSIAHTGRGTYDHRTATTSPRPCYRPYDGEMWMSTSNASASDVTARQ